MPPKELSANSYLMVPTFTKLSEMRSRKPRVMLLKESLIKALEKYYDIDTSTDLEIHRARLLTLRAILKAYRQAPKQLERIILFFKRPP